MQNVPGQTFGVQAQQEVPGMALDLEGGMAPSTFAPGPVQNVEIPFHNVPGPLGNLQVPSRGETMRAALEQILNKGIVEAQSAGMKVGAEQQAKAPFETAAREDAQAHALGIQQNQQAFTAQQNQLDRSSREGQSALDRAIKREELKLKAIEVGGGKPLSAEAASRLAVVTTAESLAKDLKQKLTGASRAQLFGLYSGTNTALRKKVEDLVDADIRIRTGAAANAEEVKSRTSQIISVMDIASGDASPIVDAIDRMLVEAQRTRQGIDPRGVYGELRVPGAVDPNAGPFQGGGPAVGTQRTINGQLARWDGRGWLPVR
jgi:hypothetical protein